MTEEGSSSQTRKPTLIFCVHERVGAQSCRGAGLSEACQKMIDDQSLEVEIITLKCFGQCKHGPVVKSLNPMKFHYQVSEEQLDNILRDIER